MARKVSKNLNAEQRVLISNDPAYWSARFVESQLHRKSYVEVPAGSSKRVDHAAVRGGLIDAYQGQIPAEVWSTLGIQPPSWSEPEVVEFVEPLAARLAIVIDGYRVSVTERNAIIRAGVASGKTSVEDLLRSAAVVPETYAIFNQIGLVRDKVLARLKDSYVNDRLIRTERLRLDNKRDISITARVFSGHIDVSLSNAGAHVKETRGKRKASISADLAANQVNEFHNLPLDTLANVAAELHKEEVQLDKILHSPNYSSAALGAKEIGEQLPPSILHQIEQRVAVAIQNAGQSIAEIRPNRKIVDAELNRAAIMTAAATGQFLAAPFMTNFIIPEIYGAHVSPSIELLNPVEAVRHMSEAATDIANALTQTTLTLPPTSAFLTIMVPWTVAAMGAFSALEVRDSIREARDNGMLGHRRSATIEARQQYAAARIAREVEVSLALDRRTEVKREVTQVNAAIVDQCIRDHNLLMAGRIDGVAAERARARLDILGPPPQSGPKRAAYGELVIAAEITRHHTAPDSTGFPKTQRIRKMLRQFRQIEPVEPNVADRPTIEHAPPPGLDASSVVRRRSIEPPNRRQLDLGF